MLDKKIVDIYRKKRMLKHIIQQGGITCRFQISSDSPKPYNKRVACPVVVFNCMVVATASIPVPPPTKDHSIDQI